MVIVWINQYITGYVNNSIINLIEIPVLATKDLYIASKFSCVCGTCRGTPLEKCSCEFAIAERQFIKEKIKAGLSTNQVIEAVNTNYGWFKGENEGQADKN